MQNTPLDSPLCANLSRGDILSTVAGSIIGEFAVVVTAYEQFLPISEFSAMHHLDDRNRRNTR